MAGRGYKKRAVFGMLWNFFFILLSAPLGYLVRILYDRNIPLVEIGLFYAVMDLISIMAIVREMGLSYSLIHFIPKFIAKKRKDLVKATIMTVAILQGIIGFAITALTIVFSRQIAVYYLSKKTIIPNIQLATAVIIIAALSSLIDCFSTISLHSILGFQEHKIYGSFNVAKMGTVLAASLVAIYAFGIRNALSPAIAYLIMPIAMLIIYSSFFFRKIFPEFRKIRISFSKKLSSEIMRYAFPLALTSVGSIIMTAIDGIFLTYLCGLEQVGIYKNAVVPTSNLLLYLASAISTVLFPMISELWARKKLDEISRGIEKTISYSMAAVIPISVFMAAFPTVILNILWTSKNLAGADALRFLSISAIFYTFYSILSNFIRATGDSKTPMKILYLGAALNFAGNCIFIPKMGMTGAAMTTMAGYILTAILAYYYTRRKIEIRIDWKRIGKSIFASVLSIAGILVVKNISENLILKLLASGIAYFGIYLGIMLITKAINFAEIREAIRGK